MESGSKILAIQGLRGIAVAAVLSSHFSLGSSLGYLGVDAFFVISGFVIARLVHRQFSDGRFSLKRFFVQRFDRLFLPLAVVVAAGLVLSLSLSSPDSFEESWVTGITALFGFSNAPIHIQTGDYFSQDAKANIFTHTWSLAVEEQFYVFFAVAAWVFARRSSSLGFRYLARAVVLISIPSALLYLFQDAFTGVPVLGALFGYYSPIPRAWQFGLGAALYWWIRNRSLHGLRGQVVRAFGPLAVIGLFLLLFVPFDPLEGLPRSTAGILASVLAGLVIVHGVVFEDRPGPLGWKPLVWVGDRSYSLYLVHWPVLTLTSSSLDFEPNPLFLLALSVGLGWLLHRFVERRTLPAPSVASRLALTLAGPLAVSLACGAAFPKLNAEATEELRDRQAIAPTCHTLGEWCVFGEPSADGRPVYLIGDSNAQMLWWGLSGATSGSGRTLISQTSTSCPGFFGNVLLSLRQIPSGCESYGISILKYLQESRPGDIVLGFSDSYYRLAGDALQDPASEILRDLRSFLDKLAKAGHRVIIARPIPNFEWSGDESWFHRRHPSSGTQFRPYPGSGPLSSGLSQLAGTRAIELLDTHAIFCLDNTCKVSDHGRLFWRDSNHLSKLGSEMLTDSWKKLLGNKS